jgi:hypothetical protein
MFKTTIFCIIIGLLKRVYEKPDGQRLLFNSIPYIEEVRSRLLVDGISNCSDPYRHSNEGTVRDDVINNDQVIFVTGRFRSGSTLLWNIFRGIPGTTSYYEPFNERQWFNTEKRGENIDNTHLGVEEYWKEYDGLESLGHYFQDSWGDKQLYMTESCCEPGMLHYIDELIRSGGERVVLQFNRIDFRLGWIRKHYPKARIIHIYRHPREQWLSYIKSPERCEPADDFHSLGHQDFFYLRRWGRDLRYVFPFLDEDTLSHPYELFYLIWRLSYNYGVGYADYSISIEEISENTESCLKEIFSIAGIDDEYLSQATTKVRNTQKKKWQRYADGTWFNKLEERCDAVLDEYYACRNTQFN